MRNNNYIAVAVGIGIVGVFAIFIAWATVASDNPEVVRDEESVVPVVGKYTGYGSVRLSEAIGRFEAHGARGLVTIRPIKEVGRLPVGQYHIRSWKTERKDDGGNTWALTGRYFGQENTFEVNNDSEARLDVGEPIIATVEARNVDSSYSFNQIIKGRRQERIALTRNGFRPEPPKLHIKNKDGSYDRTFSFHYG
jgi:hypothetical protein